MIEVSDVNSPSGSQEHVLEKIFSEFLNHPEKRVLILKGKWGVGKTFAWKKYIELKTNLNELAVSYVSLFGVANVGEIQQLILQKAVPKNIKQLRSVLKVAVPIASALKRFPIPYFSSPLGNAAEATPVLAPLLIRRFLVCFDDIERKSKDLPLSAILGLASVLKEENGCRVVLIFNEDEIHDPDDKASLSNYREKVVDHEYAYDPPVSGNVRLIFRPDEFPPVQEIFQRLAINNIRIIKFAHWNAKFFEPLLRSLEIAVRDSFLENLTILTCVFHKHANEVNLDDLPDISFIALRFREKEGRKPTSGETLLEQAQYLNQDYDPFIVQYLKTGDCKISELKAVLTALNERKKKNQVGAKLHQAWRLFNGNFKATLQEVIAGFETVVGNHLHVLAYGELKQVCDLFMVLGKKDTAEKWTEAFVESNISTMTLEETEFFKRLPINAKLQNRIAEHATALKQKISLKSVIYRIAEQSGWSQEDVAFLNSCSEEDYYKWIETETDEDLLNYLRKFHRIFNSQNSVENGGSIGVKLETVLCRLAARSPLDAHRVWVFFSLPKTGDQKTSC